MSKNHERDAQVDRQLSAMTNALRVIASYGDCLHEDHPDPNEPLCSCPVCVAKRALNADSDWRFRGAHEYRLLRNPRELMIIEAWKRYMRGGDSTATPDAKLQRLLDLDPTPRDWYVASTIVQWMGTNVGGALVEEAGFRKEALKEPT